MRQNGGISFRGGGLSLEFVDPHGGGGFRLKMGISRTLHFLLMTRQTFILALALFVAPVAFSGYVFIGSESIVAWAPDL